MSIKERCETSDLNALKMQINVNKKKDNSYKTNTDKSSVYRKYYKL